MTTVMSGHSVAPTQPGSLNAHVEGFTEPGLGVLQMDYGTQVRVRADPLTDYLALCIPLRGSLHVAHQGRRFEAWAGGTSFIGTPESELLMQWGERLQLLVVRLDLEPMRRLA